MIESGDRRVAIFVGTRPEAIKLAPVASAFLDVPGWTPIVISTGQHGTVVDEVFEVFGIPVDRAHVAWERDADLTSLHVALVGSVAADLDSIEPDVVVVQGDTATTLAGAMTAFWKGIPVVHVEAGLRSGDLAAPFPEEANRRLVSQITTLHLAPTAGAAAALAREGIVGDRVLVTGNTVVDALQQIITVDGEPNDKPVDDRRLVLVTCHRRENWGAPMQRVVRAVKLVAESHPNVRIVVATHPNPAVQEQFHSVLDDVENIEVRGPMSYLPFMRDLARATLVVTDSGGVQEEAPALGVPVLVLRDVTERPEGIEWGVAELVGTETGPLVKAIERLLDDPQAHAAMRDAVNPYGDGSAALRTVAAVDWLLGQGPRPDAFVPPKPP